MHTSRLARLAMASAAICATLFLGAPVFVQLGALSSRVAFPMFLIGALFGVIALLLGLVSIYATRPATGRAGRGLAIGATLIGALVLGVLLVVRGPAASLPPINDITTDPGDPPEFVALVEAPANVGRDMSYPGERFASQQRAGYPDLAPIALPVPPADAFQTTVGAMEGLGWEIVERDPEAGRIEATDTSHLFRFVDDIVVRIRPQPPGSRVDVRSKSREGIGDLGVNAARIRSLREALGVASLQ